MGGRRKVEVALKTYFSDADMEQLPNKPEKIKYLLLNNISNVKELQYIVETILEINYNNTWEPKIDFLNETLKPLNLMINEDNHNVEILERQPVEAMINDLQMDAINDATIKKLIPTDVLENGKKMTEAYLLIYCFENTLRTFIDNVSKDKYGDDYWNHLDIPRPVRNRVKTRIANGEKTPFHSVRGDKDLFYVDINDLYKIIERNWTDLFDAYFTKLSHIETWIEHSAVSRNHVAHNSWISSDDYDRVLVIYKDLLKQLAKHF
ncbi:Swt1 family HEPN domain-containing protein [Methanococcoides sp. AM1]|uniref:Swt1 family HEPN domain-containing protein n=1 Tax=Methanococcoides sp. AM1 TaxID=1201011 RepID=UPI00108342DE|nr:Swt1 family HEPN domain-containing protein [Methanococcoides sp. AM1]